MMSEAQRGNGTILELTNLTQRFGGLVAVDNVSLSIRRGEVFALSYKRESACPCTPDLILKLKVALPGA